jgi:hypothetical protein
LATIDPKTGKPEIIVGKDGSLNKEANFTGNMISTFVHEKGHKGDKKAATPMGEIRAITKQVNDPSFSKSGNDPNATTLSFRQSIGRYAAGNLNKGLETGSIKPAQVNTIINQLNKSPLQESSTLVKEQGKVWASLIYGPNN